MAGKAGGGIARPGSDKMLSVLSDALMQCSAHAAAYGACAQKMLPEVYGHTSIICVDSLPSGWHYALRLTCYLL